MAQVKRGWCFANCVALNVCLLKRLPIEIKEEMMDIGSLWSCNRALGKSCGKSCQFLPGTNRGGWIEPPSSSPLLHHHTAHYRSNTFWLTLPRASQSLRSIKAIPWTLIFFPIFFFYPRGIKMLEFLMYESQIQFLVSFKMACLPKEVSLHSNFPKDREWSEMRFVQDLRHLVNYRKVYRLSHIAWIITPPRSLQNAWISCGEDWDDLTVHIQKLLDLMSTEVTM